MHEKRSHKVSRSALAISLAACVALCVSVAPDEKAYADFETFYEDNWNPGNDIFSGYGLGLTDSVHGMLNMMTASAQVVYSNAQNMDYLVNQITNDYVRSIYRYLKHFDYHFYDIQAFLTSQNDYVNIGGQSMGTAANVHTLHYYLNNGLNNLVYIYSDTNMMRQFLTSQANSFVSGGTSYNTLKYYLDLYVNENVTMVTYLNEMKDDIATGTTYLQNIMSDVDFIGGFLISDTVLVNDTSTYTPYYYLKQIYNSLYRNNTTVATFLDGIRDNTYTTRNTVTTISNALSSLGTAVNTLNTTLSNIEYYIIKIQQAVVDNYQNNTSGVQVQTIKQLVNQVKDNLSYNSTSAAGFLYSINNKMDTLHSDLNYSGQSAASYLYGIYDATQTIIDYLIRLANNTSAPSPNVADSLIGEFDMDAFDENMDTLNSEIAGIGVFGCITVLGTYIEIMTDVEELQHPQLVFPFEFGGFQNQSVTVDVSWLDDLKPAINYFLEFMLVMGLTFLTWEAVKET